MTAIREPNGDLMVPTGNCCAAFRVTPDDPRYAEYAADAIDGWSDPVRDFELALEFERRHRAGEFDYIYSGQAESPEGPP